MNKKIVFLSLFLLPFFQKQLNAQNTISYTDADAHYRNGIELFEKKVFTASRTEFENFVQLAKQNINPNHFDVANAEYYIALAALYSKSLDADIVVERFVINYSEHPKSKMIFADLGNHFYANGEFEKAIKYFEKYLEYAKDNLANYDLIYKLGVSYFQLKDNKNALKYFDIVKNTASENAFNAAYYAGVINFQNENFDQAIEDFKRVENTNPYKIEVPNWIAQILFRQKKYDELLAYTEPIIQNPNGRKLDDICLVTAEVNFFRNNYTKAAMYYDKFKDFKRGVVSPQVTFRHAYSLFKINNFSKAADYFKKIAANSNDLGQQAAYYLGIAALKNTDRIAAAAAFDVARKQNYDKIIKEESQFNYAKVLVEQNNQDGTNQIQEYLKEFPNGKYVDEANEILSEILYDANNYKSAIDYIEKLKRRTPKINLAYQRLCYNQGVFDFNLERYTQAIDFFDKSLSQPSDIDIKQKAQFWKAESAYSLKLPETERLYKEIANSSNEEFRTKSTYSLGYLYFNAKDYPKALNYFKDFIAKASGKEYEDYNDAYIRLADCYLTQNKYADALKLYDDAMIKSKSEKDYIMYQKGLVLRYLGKNTEAQQMFTKLASQFPDSRMVDDALYQNGVAEIEKGSYQSAVGLLSRMIRERPKSTLIAPALLKRALAYNNLQNYNAAIDDYKLIITKYPKSDAADEALIGIKDLLSNANRTEEFDKITEDYAKNNPDNTSVVNIQYDAAKSLYFNEKYDKAVQALQKYIQTYPTNSNVHEAKYYLADSYYILNDKTNAIKYYAQVIAENQTSFVSKSAMRAGTIEVANRNYKSANSYFRTVLGASSNKREITTAWQGLVEGYYYTGNNDSTTYFCNEILNNGGNVVLGAENKAHLFLGKANMQKGNTAQAINEFNTTIALAKDVNGAEAKYFIGDIQNKTKAYKESIKTMQELARDFNEFIYWYEKGFLLISDNYVALDDFFMAKATLKSIIDNSKNAETVAIAKQKLKAIENK